MTDRARRHMRIDSGCDISTRVAVVAIGVALLGVAGGTDASAADDDTGEATRIVAPSADAATQQVLVTAWRAFGPDYEPRTEHLFEDGSPVYINRLVREASPYLLQHAHNPVDWFPRGEEAFARARAEDKPVFLSIGYATCHWCHVMERESFENEQIAALINRHYVSIKVDREQLPDVDALFMTAVQLISGDGRPFFAGTYFPPNRFEDLLARVATAWDTQRAALLEEARLVSAAISDANRLSSTVNEVSSEALSQASDHLIARVDPVAGGFGGVPKFPQESTLLFLLDQARRDDDEAALNAVLASLANMNDGAIHDQIGGGFHRYSIDRFWQVPHFETMLYNQAGLAPAFAEGAWLSGDAALVKTARDILDYVLRDMRNPDGLFFSAIDADSEGREGAFFTWTPESLREALGNDADAELAGLLWDIDGFGNVDGETIPNRAESLDSLARRLERAPEALRVTRAILAERLRISREQRKKPLRDEKVLTG